MLASLVPLFVFLVPSAPPPADDPEAAFEALTGAELVWERADVPEEVLFDRTPSLSEKRRVAAARVLLREARKYPPRFFEHIGLDTIGVFAACVSTTGDGFRAYEAELGGYRYYGLWAPVGALIAAYYTDGQLPQTFHHEVFHHIDGTAKGTTSHAHFAGDDERFGQAIRGEAPYAAPVLDAATRKELSQKRRGVRLEEALGSYAGKSAGEDQAETARWFMSNLPDALDQIVRAPELGGSQRILHLLTQYAGAAKGGVQADLAWFIDRALGREARSQAAPELDRDWLEAQAERARRGQPTAEPAAIAHATVALVRARLRPTDDDTRFTVWTPSRFQSGPNTVLQADIAQVASDAARLSAWQLASPAAQQTLRGAQDELARLLARYRAYIAANWEVSDATARAFDEAQRTIRTSLLGRSTPQAVPKSSKLLDNPYIQNVDEAIADVAWRKRIRAVQPAAVKIGNGSGVNIQASGLILTNAHVAENVGDVLTVTLADGSTFRGRTIASDHAADLALVRIDAGFDLPFAPIARTGPEIGDRLAAIGQPGKRTPSGEATGYGGWHVSVGKVRGYRDDYLGDQSLGGLKHDAWTYWGHSGSPLFDGRGAIGGLHNSWDSKTAMRHGVPHAVIVRFLDDANVAYTLR